MRACHSAANISAVFAEVGSTAAVEKMTMANGNVTQQSSTKSFSAVLLCVAHLHSVGSIMTVIIWGVGVASSMHNKESVLRSGSLDI